MTLLSVLQTALNNIILLIIRTTIINNLYPAAKFMNGSIMVQLLFQDNTVVYLNNTAQETANNWAVNTEDIQCRLCSNSALQDKLLKYTLT